MHNLYWLTGPPGTGKTTTIARMAARDAAKEEIGPDGVLITSLTRAAAAEVAGRDVPINRAHIGTLHAHARRVLGNVSLAHASLDEWNEEHPIYKLTKAGATDVDDPLAGATDAERRTGDLDGDGLFGMYQLYRAKLTPRDQWQAGVLAFAQRWEGWKSRRDLLDFNDLIDVCFEQRLSPPSSIKRIYVDEAQDHDASELRLLQFWAQYVDRMTMVGDVDQVLYSWRGADPKAFMLIRDILPDDHKSVLEQSYRVPRAVHAKAQEWIGRIANREPVVYRPRDAEGEVRYLPNATIRYPDPLINDIERRINEYYASGEQLAENEDLIMILTTCGYQLETTLKALRDAGIPYRNRYRASQGRWNPLGSGRGVSAATRFLSYLRPSPEVWGEEARMWTPQDLRRWVDVLEAKGVLKHGAKTKIDKLPGMAELSYGELLSFFEESTLEEILTLKPSWLVDHSLSPKRKTLMFVTTILERRGPRALREHPLVTTGTVHSVKGGEARCSPPDEPVLTTNRGYVPIADLDPEMDRLVSFNSDHHKIHRGGPRRPDGYKFEKGCRPYSGPLLTVTTEQSRTRVTPNHWLTVRWSPAASQNTWAVYLMRRGDWWRIGITRIHHKRGASGVLNRMRDEKGDAAWILGCFPTMRDALFHETLWSNVFGVPDLMFEAPGWTPNQLDAAAIQEIWCQLDSAPGAQALLLHRNLDPLYPLWSYIDGRRTRQAGQRNRWQVRAVNLIPGMMEIPTDPGRGRDPVWLPFEIERSHYEGTVYSLDVERWHHYVSGGAIVRNCVYLYPDLSPSGAEDFATGGERRDALMRLQYVGATRSADTLTLCGSAGKAALQW